MAMSKGEVVAQTALDLEWAAAMLEDRWEEGERMQTAISNRLWWLKEVVDANLDWRDPLREKLYPALDEAWTHALFRKRDEAYKAVRRCQEILEGESAKMH